jgi:hypothetical protein
MELVLGPRSATTSNLARKASNLDDASTLLLLFPLFVSKIRDISLEIADAKYLRIVRWR